MDMLRHLKLKVKTINWMKQLNKKSYYKNIKLFGLRLKT